MRPNLALAALFASFLLAVACHRDWEKFDVGASAGAGGTGGNVVGSGTCFPGSKVCPNQSGEPVCLTDLSPAIGCAGTACEACALPHATARCGSNGGCAIDSCEDGFLDCNADPADGCETDALSDPKHCGNCSTDCITSKGPGWVCKAGVCLPSGCSPYTTGDCDGNAANACEVDLATDSAHCGFCGNACSLPHANTACSQGVCVVTSCHNGWANCDGNDANGCEVNLSNDPGNCGSCQKVCGSANGVAGCVAGVCAILCNAGFGNCNVVVGDGCETNVSSDPGHCGSCLNACKKIANGSNTCSAGSCVISCSSGFAACSGSCVNLSTDEQNCGSCGKTCQGTCVSGQCI